MNLIYKLESFTIVSKCMEVHNLLGGGFREVVYKDALEYEFLKDGIPFSREKEFQIAYKDIILNHRYYADFVVMDKIILEVKVVAEFTPEHFAQTINYLAVSRLKLAILVNFKKDKLEYKRLVL